MKFILPTLVGLFSVTVLAETPPISSLPSCAQTCVNNMMALAPALGCASAEASCLCSNQNFLFGIRDCSNQACTASSDAQAGISWGNSFCASAGTSPVTGTGTSPVTATGTSPVTGTGTSTVGAGSASTVGVVVPVTTSDIVSTFTSDSKTFTTVVGSTTLFTTNPGGVFTSAISTAPVISTIVSGGSTFTSTVGSTTIFSSGVSTATGGVGSTISAGGSSVASTISAGGSSVASTISAGGSSVASTASAGASSIVSVISSGLTGPTGSSSSTGGAAMQTAMPGLVAAAGLAAMLL